MTTNSSALWFWRLLRFGPGLALLTSYVALWDSLFFPDRAVELPLEGHSWAYSNDQAYQISYVVSLALSCIAIAGVKAVFLWVTGPALFIAQWHSGPLFLIASENIVSGVLGCTIYNTPPVPAPCQLKADLRLPFPDMWPLAMPWPSG